MFKGLNYLDHISQHWGSAKTFNFFFVSSLELVFSFSFPLFQTSAPISLPPRPRSPQFSHPLSALAARICLNMKKFTFLIIVFYCLVCVCLKWCRVRDVEIVPTANGLRQQTENGITVSLSHRTDPSSAHLRMNDFKLHSPRPSSRQLNKIRSVLSVRLQFERLIASFFRSDLFRSPTFKRFNFLFATHSCQTAVGCRFFLPSR